MTTLNKRRLNNVIINASSTPIDGTFSGTVFKVSQKIMCTYVGKVIGVTQNIHLLTIQAAQAVFSVQQKVKCKQSQTPVYKITQMIISP